MDVFSVQKHPQIFVTPEDNRLGSSNTPNMCIFDKNAQIDANRRAICSPICSKHGQIQTRGRVSTPCLHDDVVMISYPISSSSSSSFSAVMQENMKSSFTCIFGVHIKVCRLISARSTVWGVRCPPKSAEA